MRYISCLLLSCFLWVFLSCGVASAAGPERVAAAIDAFAIDVYLQLAEGKGNIFFSPYSIASALAMTYAGADGETAAEMAKALRFADIESADQFSPHASLKKLRDSLGAISGDVGTLEIANRLWLDREMNLLPDYTALVGENYSGGVEKLNFVKDAEGARATINGWVAERTHDKIRNLLQDGDVTPLTRLVLTNAIYFNSVWMEPFRKELTEETPFRAALNERKNVPMMRRTGFFFYGEAPELQLIKIPYRAPGLSLLVLLPRENESFTQLEQMERKLSPRELSAWTAAMTRREVTLRLPKFRDEQRCSLKEILEKLGMKLAFSGGADFSKMADASKEDRIAIDAVIHQAFIELDERGTEAAAATAVGMMRTTAFLPREDPIEFRADHPFVYCIMDDATGTILFMGRMAGP